MPFSVNGDRDAVESAINDAAHRGKILIASAANFGGNTGRAYPAKDERVICMHASDGRGNDAHGINPSPWTTTTTDNFTTLGLGIRFSWSGENIWKSGTSYSAPVAAGIAASIIHHARRPELAGKLSADKLCTGEGMKKVFRRMGRNEIRQGYNYIAPWNLWKDGLDEGDVCSLIKEELVR